MESINHTNCSDNGADHVPSKEVIRCSLSVVSVAVCCVAVILFYLYKLHRYFNYRLVLYLLLASMFHSTAHALQLPMLWIDVSFEVPDAAGSIYCDAVAFLEEFSGLLLLLCIAFLCAKIFVMTICFSELSKVEVPCAALCIVLPVLISAVPFATRTYGLSGGICWIEQNMTNSSKPVGHIEQYALWYGPVIAIGTCCLLCTVIATTYITYLSLKNRLKDGPVLVNLEIPPEISLQRKYNSALKETLPFMMYPFIILVVTVPEVASVVLYSGCTAQSNYSSALPAVGLIADVSAGCLGMLCASSFFIHLLILGKQKRAKLRRGKRTNENTIVTSYGSVNQQGVITTAGSITGTHPTIFEPLGESDVDRNHMRSGTIFRQYDQQN